MARLYCAPDDMLRLRSGLKWSRVGRGELPADIAELDFAVASPIRSALLRAVRLSDFGYPDFAEGSPVTLKKVFSARTRRLYGWTPRTELTELSAQVTQALCCVVLAFTRPGDRVLVHTPAYPPFLAAIREWGKKVVLVLNKSDLLRTDADLAEVVAFVGKRAGETLGVEPQVFALSAWGAQIARQQADAAALERSGLPAFEAQVGAMLDEHGRFRLKLLSPLGVARRALREADERAIAGLAVLEGDTTALAAIEARLGGQEDDLTRDLRLRLSDVEKTLLEFERRGHAFFDERLRLGRFRELFDRERLRRDFEAEVTGALPHEIERRVSGIVDFLVEAELRQWQDVMALLAERPAAGRGSATRVDKRFAWNRARMLEEVGAAAREAVAHYDASGEARRLAEKVRESLAQAALLQVSALGLGTIVAALASTTAADVTGILAAGALSLIGLFLLPARREKARRELAAKVSTLRERLMRSLGASFDAERARAAARIREAVAPYAAFVGREQQRLTQARATLAALSARLEELVVRAGG